VLDVVADGDRPFVEIEYVEGPRLSTLVRRHGRLSAERACALGHQLAATLDHLHAEGVLHLDVKPSNVIMGPIPRLIDLSVARTVDRVPSITGHVGTDAYMAPEQADPSRWATIGPATDAWGLAATLYYTISRRTPHSRGDRGAAGPARFPQLVERPAPLDTVRHAPGLVELLMSTLVPEPAHRPSMKELVGRFDELARRARRDEARPWRPGLASSRRGRGQWPRRGWKPTVITDGS
jgi:serine/threonine protein kinase